MSDLFGLAGRELLQRLELPGPWRQSVDASLHLIDELDYQIAELGKELRKAGADHRYVPLLLTVPGISWVLAYTIAAEIGDISRFANPNKLTGYAGLCPRVVPSGDRDLRGPLTKHGPKYLRWALPARRLPTPIAQLGSFSGAASSTSGRCSQTTSCQAPCL